MIEVSDLFPGIGNLPATTARVRRLSAGSDRQQCEVLDLLSGVRQCDVIGREISLRRVRVTGAKNSQCRTAKLATTAVSSAGSTGLAMCD
jgi:hypothetical protein